MINNRPLIFAFVIILSFNSLAQLKLDRLPSDFKKVNDSLFFGLTSSRHIQSLHDNWKVFRPDEPDNSTDISFPLKFSSQETIIFEKESVLLWTWVFIKLIYLEFH